MASNLDDKEMLDYQIKVKKSISELINTGELNTALQLIHQYEQIIQNDIEVLTMKAVIAIMSDNLSSAEETLLKVLAIDEFQPDGLYNLAYVYEQQGRYFEAIKIICRLRKVIRYDFKQKEEIDNIFNRLYCQLEQQTLTVEEQLTLTNLKNNKDIFIFDFALQFDSQLKNFVNSFSEQGINFDLGYYFNKAINVENIAFRKTIKFSSIEEIIDYVKFYNYDSIHFLNASEEYIASFKSLSNKIIFDKVELLSGIQRISELRDFYEFSEDKFITIKEKINPELITLIIPTHNRSNLLPRTLYHFFNILEDLNIVILDSSSTEHRKANKDLISSLCNKKIEYIELPEDIAFLEKLNYGFKSVHTKYTCLCGDDDFLTKEGITESLRFLENNESYYSVKGKNFYFVSNMASILEHDFFMGNEALNPLDRLEAQSKKFFPTFIYQVFRTDKLSYIYQFLSEQKDALPKNMIFQEYLLYYLVILSGRVAKLNIDLNLRDISIPRATNFENIPHTVLDKTFNEEYARFKSVLIKFCNSLGIDGQNLNDYFDQIFRNFMISWFGIPEDLVEFNAGVFNLDKLSEGLKKSRIWSRISV